MALGESIVAIGVGAAGALNLGIGTVAVLGVALAAAMWWIYFDVVALISARRLAEAEVGRAQNELARDSYSYIHLALVAGVVLVALGMKTSIGHHDEHLHDVPAFALLGGTATYLLGLVGFRYRHIHTINRQRLGLAIVLLLLIPVATELPAIATVAIADVLIWAMIAYEHQGYDERREQLRREASVSHSAPAET
ncbi:MAG: low temperature requirement protein A [Solirubrobacterales bacterium]